MGLAGSWLYAVVAYTVCSCGWPGCGFTQLSVTQSVRGVDLVMTSRSDRYAVSLWGWPGRGFTQLLITQSVRGVDLVMA